MLGKASQSFSQLRMGNTLGHICSGNPFVEPEDKEERSGLKVTLNGEW